MLGGMLVLGLAGTAYAHLALESSEPAKGDRLAVAPSELRLTFTETVELAVARITLRDPAGEMVALSPLVRPPDSVTVIVAPIRGPLRSGTYTLEWQVAGTDGHPVRGTFSFEISPGADGLVDVSEGAHVAGDTGAGETTSEPNPLAGDRLDSATMVVGPGFDAESPAYVAVRWLQYTGLLIAVGALAFHLLVLRFMGRTATDELLVQLMRIRAATIGYWATLLVALSAVLRLYAQSVAVNGGEALRGELIGPMLMRTLWGWGWMLQIAAVVIAIAGFHLARRARAGGWVIALAGVLVLAVTPALSGHAASAQRLTAIAVLVDTLHVIGAGGWLGSLLVLLAAGLPVALRSPNDGRGANVANLVNTYSPTALIFAGTVVASGVFAAWLHAGISSALWESRYGQTLLLKFGVFSLVAAIGVYNWRRVRPALGDERGALRIRRSATAELLVGALVLIVTAVLVATPPPTHTPDSSAHFERLPVTSE